MSNQEKMKQNFKSFLFVYMFYTIPFFCIAQNNGRAYYKKHSDLKIFNKSRVQDSEKSKAGDEIDSLFILEFNDSLATYYKARTFKNTNDILGSGYRGPYFFDLSDKSILRVQGKYLIKKKASDYNWYLLDETSTINGLTCYKATTSIIYEGRRRQIKRIITAWYTLDVCVPVGPDGFGGLPGLIIRLENDKITTTLQTLKFTDEDYTITVPMNKRVMNEVKFKHMTDSIINTIDYK